MYIVRTVPDLESVGWTYDARTDLPGAAGLPAGGGDARGHRAGLLRRDRRGEAVGEGRRFRPGRHRAVGADAAGRAGGGGARAAAEVGGLVRPDAGVAQVPGE